jgi:hypothetical protein
MPPTETFLIVNYATRPITDCIVGRRGCTTKQHRAPVASGYLSGFKKRYTLSGEKGVPHGGWRKSLKKVQLGKLESILSHELVPAGSPAASTVFPTGTSRTCPACGH